MIVRDRPPAWRLFLVLRGSVLPRIQGSLAAVTLLAIAITWCDGTLWGVKVHLTAIPFTLLGLPLAIFLGFRNNAAYDRYWEGRKQWGELVLRSRNLARQCLGLIDPARPYQGEPEDLRARMLRRAIAHAHALRHHLRKTAPGPELLAWLDPGEGRAALASPNLPHFLMLQMGADLARCLREGRIDPLLASSIDATLSAMVGVTAACERIRNTPIPFSYTLLLHRTAYLYCFLLPFGLVDAIGFLTPLVTAMVAYTLFGLDALGDEIEEPFGASDNDLPLDAMCRTIEIDLLAALGSSELPPQLAPVNYQLT